MNKNLANAFAVSAAALFIAGCAKGGEAGGAEAPAAGGPETAAAKVKCLGINECKGQGQCDMPTHSCAGQNECKGKGWILVSQDECDTKGGTVKE